MMLCLAINGKFLSAPPTGVHRVASELVNALVTLVREAPGTIDMELWVPRDGVACAASIPLRLRVLRPFTGIPWEQITAARHDRARLLLSLCNIAPVARANAVTMIHDVQVHTTPRSYGRGFRLWYKLAQPLAGRRHKLVLTVSEHSRREIARVGICPIERIVVIPNGADHIARAVAAPRIIARLTLESRRYVLALASRQAHKNVALLMAAFADPRLSGLRLVLFGGDGPESFAAAGVDVPGNVVFAGRVTDGELRALYEEALCLAFPSRTEGFGLPPLEAMLLGCPAIVAPCGALPEVCGSAALYADPDRPDEWVAAIRSLIEDPVLRERRSIDGAKRARLFTWRAAAEKLVAALLPTAAAERAAAQTDA